MVQLELENKLLNYLMDYASGEQIPTNKIIGEDLDLTTIKVGNLLSKMKTEGFIIINNVNKKRTVDVIGRVIDNLEKETNNLTTFTFTNKNTINIPVSRETYDTFSNKCKAEYNKFMNN